MAFKDLVDELPEQMVCPRRDESPAIPGYPAHDHWQRFKTNGDRVCSYCGSLHPDDFITLVKASAEAAEDDLTAPIIDPSTKNYKIYARRANVSNAHEGGIKFYTRHLIADPTEEQQAQYREAQRRTRKRTGL